MADSVTRPLDRALEAWASGDHAAALRFAVPVLEAQPDGAGALLATAYLGAKVGEPKRFELGLKLAAHHAIDLGNLPLAVAAGALTRELGLDPAGTYDAIATAYARGSARIKHRAPPALPAPALDVKPLPEELAGAPLLERALEAVEKAIEHIEAKRDPKSPLPATPLFSSLDRASLRAFVEIFEIRLYAAKATVVEEGTLGSEAFVVARGELDVTKRGAGGSPIHLARLGGGTLVGEMALLSRAPRAATVSTASSTVLLVAEKQALDAAVTKSPELGREFAEHCRRRMLDNLIKTSPILRSVNPTERTDLVKRFSIRAFEPGERIVSQGQPSEGLFLIASGEVAIVQNDEAGEKTVVARLATGEVLGEVALVLRRPAIADVVANHPTVTLYLPRDRFLEAVRAHPMVFVDLYEVAVRRDEETSAVAELEAASLDESILV
ncbi:MAG TPA: cyclic nucleotide-binding domain-containing protein [Polyangiaceae bacterium]